MRVFTDDRGNVHGVGMLPLPRGFLWRARVIWNSVEAKLSGSDICGEVMETDGIDPLGKDMPVNEGLYVDAARP